MSNKDNLGKKNSSIPPKMVGKFKTEFNMGWQDFDRIGDILKLCNIYRINVNNRDISHKVLRGYYSVLDTLYGELKPLCYETNETRLNTKIKVVEELLLEWEKKRNNSVPIKLIQQIKDLHDDLMAVRQAVGLGMPLLKHESKNKKIERVLLSKE